MSVVYNRKMNGKLMLTGEYFVLEGATALALPTVYGQELYVTQDENGDDHTWQSVDCNENVWLDLTFDTDFNFNEDRPETKMLQKIFTFCNYNSLVKIEDLDPIEFKIFSNFENNWGLGSSSTLIALMADFFDVNPYQLLANTFGGSGYDIACAMSDKAVLYTLDKPFLPIVKQFRLSFPFQENIYFAYLGKKQNSREGMKYFDEVKNSGDMPQIISSLNQITEDIQHCKTLEAFESLLNLHEDIIHKALHLPKVRDLHFADWNGSVKSLGAWGGDFVLITHKGAIEELINYLNTKNIDTVFRYTDIIL
jgi:mevalonate kinase